MVNNLAALFTGGNMMFLLRGLGMTLLLTICGCGIGLVGGFLAAYVRTGRGRLMAPARILATVYVEIFRRIPFLVTLFLVLYASQIFFTRVPMFWVAATAICFMSAAYLAEIVRAGIESIPHTQMDAAEVMNFSRFQAMRMVVLPQAVKVIFPATIAYVVMFVKDTALASQAGVFELMFAGKALINRGLDPFLVMATVLFAYFAISWPLAHFGRRLENRLSRRPKGDFR